MGQVPWVSSANPFEVLPCGRERQVVVRPAPHYVGIMVVLTVILPEADWTNLISLPLTEGAIAAAGTGKGWPVNRGHRRSMPFTANVRNGWKADINLGADTRRW